MNYPIEGFNENWPPPSPDVSVSGAAPPPAFAADEFDRMTSEPSLPQGYSLEEDGAVLGPDRGPDQTRGVYIPTESTTEDGRTVYYELNSERNFTFGSDEASGGTGPQLYRPAGGDNNLTGFTGEKLVEQQLADDGWIVISPHDGNSDLSFQQQAAQTQGRQGIDTIAYRVEEVVLENIDDGAVGNDEPLTERIVHVLVIETKSTGQDAIRPSDDVLLRYSAEAASEPTVDQDDAVTDGANADGHGYDPEAFDREIMEMEALEQGNAEYWEENGLSEFEREAIAARNTVRPQITDPGGVGDLGRTEDGPQNSDAWIANRIIEHAQTSGDPEVAALWPDSTVMQRVIKAEVADVVPGDSLEQSSGNVSFYDVIDDGEGNIEVIREPVSLNGNNYSDPYDATRADSGGSDSDPRRGGPDGTGPTNLGVFDLEGLGAHAQPPVDTLLRQQPSTVSPFEPLDPSGDLRPERDTLSLGDDESGVLSAGPDQTDRQRPDLNDERAVTWTNNGVDTDRRFETSANASGVLYEREFSTSDSVVEVGYENEYVSASLRGPGYEVGGNASVTIDGGTINASVEANAAVYLAQAEFEAEYGPLSAGASAMVGAEATAGTEIAFDPMSGDVGVGVELEAFAGARAEAEAGVAISDNATVTGGGYVSYGVGAEFEADVGLEDGKFSADFDIGATLGVGAGFDVSFEVDIVDTAGDVVGAVGDVGGAVADVGSDVGGAIADVGGSIGGGIKKLGGLFG